MACGVLWRPAASCGFQADGLVRAFFYVQTSILLKLPPYQPENIEFAAKGAGAIYWLNAIL